MQEVHVSSITTDGAKYWERSTCERFVDLLRPGCYYYKRCTIPEANAARATDSASGPPVTGVPIRVLMVCHSFNAGLHGAGGAERQAAILIPRLVAMGCSVSVVASDSGTNRQARGTIDGATHYRLPAPRRSVYLLALAGFLLRHRHEYDLVHVHSPDMDALVTAIACRVISKPLLAKRRSSHEMRHYGRLRREILARLVTVWVALDEPSRRYMKGLGIPAHRIRLLVNGVDLDRYPQRSGHARAAQREALGLRTNDFVVVWTGRYIRLKRVDVLIRAWRKFIERYEGDTTLVLIGDGPELDFHRREAGELVHSGSIRFVGRVPAAGVEKYLQVADAFALPSMSEGMSNSLLEAMAAELSIVCTPVGAAPELVENEKSALFVPVDDEEALTDALERLATDGELRRRLARGSRQNVEERHAIARVAEAYLETYLDLVGPGLHAADGVPAKADLRDKASSRPDVK